MLYGLNSGLTLPPPGRPQEEENIPLRIMLLLMDGVFDLRNRNQWLRGRIVAILRQFVKTMFGDSINRSVPRCSIQRFMCVRQLYVVTMSMDSQCVKAHVCCVSCT